MKNQYIIQKRIETLAHCAVMDKMESQPSFSIEDLTFSPWGFNIRDGWISNAWVVSGTIDAQNIESAYNIFFEKLKEIIPRISLISQAYIEFVYQPFIIYQQIDDNKPKAFVKIYNDASAVGLFFDVQHREALEILIKNTFINKEFYYYWKDAVNTIGGSTKLLLMFSAIEALVKKKDGKKDWTLIDKIFGKSLKNQIYGKAHDTKKGLRNRLVHGEYFSDSDSNDLVEKIHKKIVTYFNNNIFQKQLIDKDVVAPQRNIYGNKEEWSGFYIEKKKASFGFDLKDVLSEFYKNCFNGSDKYTIVEDTTDPII